MSDVLVKRGRGRPRKYPLPKTEPSMSTHKLYEDGTYSNDKDEVVVEKVAEPSLRDRIHKNVILSFGVGPHSWSGVVHKVTDKGVYCRANLHEEVDLSRCTFYNWQEIETQVSGVA